MRSSIVTATLFITAAVAQNSGPANGEIGCFSALPGALFSAPTNNTFNTPGLCRNRCRSADSGGPAYRFVALQGNQCFCGIGLPLASDRVAEDQCSTVCPGFPAQMCGGQGVYTVLLTSPDGDGGASTSSSSTITMSSLIGSPSTAGNGTTAPTSIATAIPTAGAVSEHRLVGSVAAALGLSAVCNLL